MYGVVRHVHPVSGDSHNQRNTTEEVTTTSPPFYNEPHRSFMWRLNSARPSHSGHSTILLQSEIPSDMCAKLCVVAASNNIMLAISFTIASRATYIMVLFFAHIPFVVNHTINATPPERLQQ